MVMSRERKNLRTLIICHIVGLVFVNLYAGFAHDIARSFPNVITQVLFPINYSLGQSVKLITFPILIVFIAEYFIVGRHIDNFITSHLMIITIIPIAVMTFYHTYDYVLKSTWELNTSMFIVISEAFFIIAFFSSVLMTTSKRAYKYHKIPAIVLSTAIVALFVVVSFSPPQTATFFDEINRTFASIF